MIRTAFFLQDYQGIQVSFIAISPDQNTICEKMYK